MRGEDDGAHTGIPHGTLHPYTSVGQANILSCTYIVCVPDTCKLRQLSVASGWYGKCVGVVEGKVNWLQQVNQ